MPSIILEPTLEYYGNSGVILTDPGTLTSDNTGLQTCKASFSTQVANFGALPDIGDAHPIFTYLAMEKRELSIKGAWAVASCYYAGISGGGNESSGTNQIVYELRAGVGDQKIETHPDFEKFAGSPKAPINGAVFESIYQPGLVARQASPAPSNAGWVFKAFEIFIGDKLNEFAGIHHYLSACEMIWTKSWNSRVHTSSVRAVGFIDHPEGPAPSLPSGRNWLNVGVTATKRGSAYACVQEWRASGMRRWNRIIYGPR